MKQVNPYISFDGNCEEAFNFYKSVFGGELDMMRFADMKEEMSDMGELSEEHLNMVANVALPIGGNTLLMGDDGPAVFGSKIKRGGDVVIALEPDSTVEAKNVFAALSEGGEVTMPLEETSWAESFGQCKDKYGVSWMINYTGNKG